MTKITTGITGPTGPTDGPGDASRSPATRWGPLTECGLPWSHRLVALQGWRGDEIDRVLQAGPAVRFAPALCASGAVAVVLTGSPVLVTALAASAAVGAASGRHPIEWAHLAWAERRGRAGLPPARAGRRFACALAGTWLATVGAAQAAGRGHLAAGLGLSLAAAAAVFTVTGLCLPSLLLTAVAGAERATGATLGGGRPAADQRRPDGISGR